MQGKVQGTKSDTAGRGEISKDNLTEKMLLDPRAIRVCCGHPIEPRLAEIRNLSGSTLFVSVWRCPFCDRVTL